MLQLLNHIREDWRVWAEDREVKVLHQYAEIGRKFSFVYAVTIYSTGVIFMTQPVIPTVIDVLFKNGSEPKQYPFPVYWGEVDMDQWYFYIMAYSFVCVSSILVINIAGDLMIIGTILHGCGIFAAVGHKLERLGNKENCVKDTLLMNERDVAYENISWCIDRHNDAIEYAKLLEETYSLCFMAVVGINMLMLSTTSLQVVTRENEVEDLIKFANFVAVQMAHLYVEMNISQMLTDSSASIQHYAQRGEWYKISLKAQKLLILMTLRSNVTCKLTAGKICVMSMESYTQVVRASLSYFTLLRSMQ